MYAAVEAPGQASPSATPIKVMIVDDSAVVRGLVSRWVEEEAGLEVVSRHANGQLAVDDIAQSAPDIVLLDIEMPEMDGLQALPLLLAARPETRVLMVSTLTRRDAEISFKAPFRLQSGRRQAGPGRGEAPAAIAGVRLSDLLASRAGDDEARRA
jgi:two-component system, chemotaxis family, protein-glutamate methylesterase/glutaminase